jgi:hypothetical protein
MKTSVIRHMLVPVLVGGILFLSTGCESTKSPTPSTTVTSPPYEELAKKVVGQIDGATATYARVMTYRSLNSDFVSTEKTSLVNKFSAGSPSPGKISFEKRVDQKHSKNAGASGALSSDFAKVYPDNEVCRIVMPADSIAGVNILKESAASGIAFAGWREVSPNVFVKTEINDYLPKKMAMTVTEDFFGVVVKTKKNLPFTYIFVGKTQRLKGNEFTVAGFPNRIEAERLAADLRRLANMARGQAESH